MKKSLLILSLLAAASSAVAFDELAPGTASAPNYYLMYANRGTNRYMCYSADEFEFTRGEDVVKSHLGRTAEVSTANVWAVTPGTEEGSIVVKSYVANAYLANYFFPGKEGETFEINSTADTQSAPRDIFPVQWPGTLAYALNVGSEEQPEDGYNSLDAPGGDTQYIGNWQPTNPDNGEGTAWWFVNVTPGPGETVEGKIAEHVKALVIPELQAYMPTCGIVAAQLQAGIDAINALPYSSDLASKIVQAKEDAIKAANDYLATSLSGKYIVRNLRRTTNTYLSFNPDQDNIIGINDPMSQYAAIEFKKHEGGGYFMYNAAVNKYMVRSDEGVGKDVYVSADQDDATIVYPSLLASPLYHGIAFIENPGANSPVGINFNSAVDKPASTWYCTGGDIGGSIWEVAPQTYQTAIDEIVKDAQKEFSPFIANENIPAGASAILYQTLKAIKALPATADGVAQATALQAKGMEDAQAYLANELNGKVYSLKYLRGNVFVSVEEEEFAYTSNAEESQFTFIKLSTGGYQICNEETGLYIADSNEEGLLILSDDKDLAITIYPYLASNGNLVGVALGLEDTFTGKGLNMNGDKLMHAYNVKDAGSMWGLIGDPVESISAIAAPKAIEGIYDLQGRKLSAPIKGINIINGVKVLVK